jgi:DNA-directed RNA polymerase subunit E'/Rpb7
MNGICCVANSVAEACEILRIARSVMYSRNKKMQRINLNDLADWKPQEYTGKIWITGREFNENDKIRVRIGKEEQEMTALEIYEYLYN